MGFLSEREIEIKCPECDYDILVLVEDIIQEKEIICGGCKKTIALKVTGDDVSNIDADLDNLLKDFSKSLNIKI